MERDLVGMGVDLDERVADRLELRAERPRGIGDALGIRLILRDARALVERLLDRENVAHGVGQLIRLRLHLQRQRELRVVLGLGGREPRVAAHDERT